MNEILRCLGESAGMPAVSYDSDEIRNEFKDLGGELESLSARYGGAASFSFEDGDEDNLCLLSSDFDRDSPSFETESDADEFEGKADALVREWCRDHGRSCDRFDVGQLGLAYWIPMRANEATGSQAERYQLRVEEDEDYQPQNPRKLEGKVGHFALFHRSYDFKDPDLELDYGAASGSMQELHDVLVKEEDAAVMLPVSATIHSGVTLHAGKPDDRWDSGTLGFAYVTRDELNGRFGGDEGRAVKALEDAVEEYSEYWESDGPWYEWEIYDPVEGQVVDSMTGYDDRKECLAAGRRALSEWRAGQLGEAAGDKGAAKGPSEGKIECTGRNLIGGRLILFVADPVFSEGMDAVAEADVLKRLSRIDDDVDVQYGDFNRTFFGYYADPLSGVDLDGMARKIGKWHETYLKELERHGLEALDNGSRTDAVIVTGVKDSK